MAKKPAARITRSLDTLRSQANRLAPKRSKLSDGWLGDAKHSMRKSDHNPEPDGTVDAFDLTHDPKNGVDIQRVCDAIIASRDPRVSYLICNGKIISGNSGPRPWVKRNYTGANKHTKHLHVSVLDKFQDDSAPWKIDAAFKEPAPRPEPKPVAIADLTVKQVNSVMHIGSKGDFVGDLQRNLNRLGYGPIEADGNFGKDTDEAVRAFQKDANLDRVDGWAGPSTVGEISKELEKRKTAPKIAAAEKVVNAAASGGNFSKTEIITTVTGVTGTATVVKEGVDAVRESTTSFVDLASTVGPWVLLTLVLASGAAYIVYDRRRKRLEAQAVKKVL